MAPGIGTTDQKKLVRREYEEVWAGGDVDVLDESCSPSIVVYGLPTSEESADLDMFKEFVSSCRGAFSDLRHDIVDMISEDDRVVARTRFAGRHSDGRFMGTEPADCEVEIGNTVTYRIEDGHVAEAWVCFDTLGLLQQIGAVPNRPQAYNWAEIGE